MGKTRVCGGTCHNAKRSTCRCWCGGVFHGAAAKPAREAFARELGVDAVPTTESEFQRLIGQPSLFDDASVVDRWRSAVAAAVAARSEPAAKAAHAAVPAEHASV